MARTHPANPHELRLAGAPAAELETLERLAARLPDEYTIFHSVRWAEMTPARQRFGELDFVVVNQAGDMLIIEQKNGALHEGAETLEKEYPAGRKSVVWQVHRARDGVLSSLAEAGITPPTVSVLVYCPDHRLASVSAAGLSVDAVVDATERERLAERIQKLLGPGRGDDGARARDVRAFLAQALALEPDLGRTIELHERTFQRLRSGLTEVLEGLEFHPWRLRVRAPAGAGKSIAAANAFRRARQQGQRVLLVCFNRPLADQLQRALGEQQDVDSFHGLARQWTDRFGPGFDPSRVREAGQEYWNSVVDELAVIAEHAGPYDMLIVDEGQDFEPEWWEILQLAMKPDFDCLWLQDGDQALYEREPVPLKDFVDFRVQGNFRTPARVARYIERLLGWRMDWRNTLSGMHPTVCTYGSPEEQQRLLEERVEALCRIGFLPEQIAVVSLHGLGRAVFRDLDAIGLHRLNKFTGRYTAAGEPVYTDGTIQAETVFRFKGQQAPAVILCDVALEGEETARAERLLYCGLTRATVVCDLLAVEGGVLTKRLQRAAR